MKDKPGVLSFITKKLANKNISVERLIQKPNYKNKTASIIIITHETKEIDVKTSLNNITKNKNILKSPVLIRLL